ncbi:MAG: MerR family transcriptional regulator [Anaerolineales bacterium]|nr:MerR family transcriptional regulator [Anaerolineales bacterium]
MNKYENAYTVSQLAKMAGISVRTLHHYDHIGLLKPSSRTEAGYRQYNQQDLLRLQQILFYKELDVPLQEIGSILDDPDFDPVATLHSHKRRLQARANRLTRLLKTIDKTLHKLAEDDTMKDEDLYAGFTPEQAERYDREAKEMWGAETVEASKKRLRKMSKAQWQAIGAEGDAVTRGLAELVGHDVGETAVQHLIARHYTWLSHFFQPSAEAYRGMSQMYATHPEFRAFYENFAPGLADFMQAAMTYYADHTLRD